MARTIVFIDGSNLYHSLRNFPSGRTDLNFEVFCQKLYLPNDLVRVYYYNAPVDQTKESARYKEQQSFFYQMRRVPYLELKLGRLVYRNWPTVPPYEKGVDVQMATDMLVHGSRGTYDELILVSGDTDFSDALQAIKDMGRHVQVALFPPDWSSQKLRDVADRVIPITPDFLKGCWK